MTSIQGMKLKHRRLYQKYTPAGKKKVRARLWKGAGTSIGFLPHKKPKSLSHLILSDDGLRRMQLLTYQDSDECRDICESDNCVTVGIRFCLENPGLQDANECGNVCKGDGTVQVNISL